MFYFEVYVGGCVSWVGKWVRWGIEEEEVLFVGVLWYLFFVWRVMKWFWYCVLHCYSVCFLVHTYMKLGVNSCSSKALCIACFKLLLLFFFTLWWCSLGCEAIRVWHVLPLLLPYLFVMSFCWFGSTSHPVGWWARWKEAASGIGAFVWDGEALGSRLSKAFLLWRQKFSCVFVCVLKIGKLLAAHWV